MIEVQGLTRYYGYHPAVLDLSFRINANEIVGFLGLNGAGKSTTLKILAGLLLPSAGSVSIKGVDLLSAPDSLRSRIGFLPEDPPLYLDMKVREFISFCGQLKGMPADQVAGRLDKVLKDCNLDEFADRVIGTLSHGQRKRVGIAQAIIHDPDLVILDEPISGLDPRQIREIREVIVSLKASHTVLISSHILSEISQTCDRILVLKGGRVVAEGTEDELAARLSGGGRVILELRGDPDDAREALGSFESVTSHEVTDLGGGLIKALAVLSADEREALVVHLIQAGLGLRRLDDAESELEEIFLNLTKEGQA
ncbi:MAG: ABC transporter ATP-binding protein [Alphaproteobacteria bacterium]|nr:ABC transporter ATP-binding protein [Alphaproteobacteria bacterium]